MRYFLLSLVLVALLASPSNAQKKSTVKAPSPATEAFDYDALFKPLKWRSIGPFRGGRSVTASGVAGDINTYYMGTTGGGLWKTTDMGKTWFNVSDGFFKTGSVGAIAVAESDPNVVYVGMGEHAVRGVMTHHGDGMYKSTDAGKSWSHTGLDSSQHISRVLVHPANPDLVLAGVQGALYGPSTQRGVYRSADGGKTWTRTLYVNNNTGCVELSMDMTNPRILYAAMWEHGRRPWQVISGGPGSGLYKSTDGGLTWEKLSNGLPSEMGKMAIAVSRSNPEKVYALIESDSQKEAGGLFVSNNGGNQWSRVTNDHRLVQRAWYYIELFIDPTDENKLYVLSAPMLKSIDGGQTWDNMDTEHGDHHDLWINPKDPKNMILADDGGAVITFNSGTTWSAQSNMPTAQLYRINVDNQFPYRIYAGQQDNTTVAITSRLLGSGGIDRTGWAPSAGGESAFLAFDPDNPRHVMGGSYQGTIEVLDTKSNASTQVMAAPIQYLGMDAKEMKYRFNWNAPIIWSKWEPNTFYHGAQKLLKTSDMGMSWKEVSGDLTRNDTSKQGRPGVPYTNEAVGAENYGTLAYVAESPLEKGVIWTGSDDGLVHVTRDGGTTWQNVTPTGLKECLVNAIEVSPHNAATVYIATTRYKFNDHTPGLYKTTDYGKTWTAINTGLPANAFTRVVREDDKRRDLLYAGTELGVFVSWDGGRNWSPFQLNLPVTPVTDLRVHQGDLIAATSGRSFWILDDLSMVRQYSPSLDSFHVYKPEDPVLVSGYSEMDRNGASGTNPLRGVNPATGAVIYYQLPNLKPDEHIELEIRDAAGKLVRSFSSKPDSTYRRYDGAPPPDPVLGRSKGLNRFVWNLRYPTAKAVPNVYIESSYSGHKAAPGRYTVMLRKGATAKSSDFEILPNPLYGLKVSDYQEYDRFMGEMENNVDEMHRMVNSLYGKQEQLSALLKGLPAGEKYAALRTEGEALLKDMKKWDEDMIQRKSKAYDDVENFPNKFTANYMFLVNATESDIPRVNQGSKDRRAELDARWATLKAEGNRLLNQRIPDFNRRLFEAGIGAIHAQ
jgi:photosystem II stability/assembly factor-like uncharacterized protein